MSLVVLVLATLSAGFQSPANALEDALWAFLKAGAQAGENCDDMAQRLASWRKTHEVTLNTQAQAVVRAINTADSGTLDVAQAWLQTLGTRLVERDDFLVVSACQGRHEGVSAHIKALMEVGLAPTEQALEVALQSSTRQDNTSTINERQVVAAIGSVSHYIMRRKAPSFTAGRMSTSLVSRRPKPAGDFGARCAA